MPTYYLHLHECGLVTEDEAGTECRNVAAARQVAIEAARDVMAGEMKAGRLCLGCFVVIADKAGTELDRVLFKDALTLSGI